VSPRDKSNRFEMAEQIIQKVKDAGVVGAGGAGFPTHVKIAAQVDTVIANGAECDPLLRCDQQLMAAHAPEVIEGLRLVMQASGAERGVIALKREYTSAVAALQSNIQYPISNTQGANISLHLLENHYPAGDEFVLVYEVTGRLVPEDGLPLHVGCIVQNVGTLFNIAMAQRGYPPLGDRHRGGQRTQNLEPAHRHLHWRSGGLGRRSQDTSLVVEDRGGLRRSGGRADDGAAGCEPLRTYY